MERVFLAFDPSLGRPWNTITMVGYFEKTGQFHFFNVNIYATQTQSEEFIALDDQIARLTQMFPNSEIVIITENNIGSNAEHLNDHIKARANRNVSVFHGPGGRPGVRLTSDIRLKYEEFNVDLKGTIVEGYPDLAKMLLYWSTFIKNLYI